MVENRTLKSIKRRLSERHLAFSFFQHPLVYRADRYAHICFFFQHPCSVYRKGHILLSLCQSEYSRSGRRYQARDTCCQRNWWSRSSFPCLFIPLASPASGLAHTSVHTPESLRDRFQMVREIHGLPPSLRIPHEQIPTLCRGQYNLE